MSFRQLHVVVLNAIVPCELEAVVDGETYYWRSRGRHWYLHSHVVDSVNREPNPSLYGKGVHSEDDPDDLVEFGIQKILYYHSIRPDRRDKQ